jgi:hypothetical protein
MIQPLTITTPDQLRLFMEHHVFAVWDFMLLLKSLQQHVAPSGAPWVPPRYPGVAGLVNALVAEEECDCLPEELGGPAYLSHFAIYRKAMLDIGADCRAIDAVLMVARRSGIEEALLHPAIPAPSRTFMTRTWHVISSGRPHLLAAAFCYGRECLVPQLFVHLRDQILHSNLSAPTLLWYLQRHITLDGDSHGPLAERMVQELCAGDPQRIRDVAAMRNTVVQQRSDFWTSIAGALHAPARLPVHS